jgi:hypothetical protein
LFLSWQLREFKTDIDADGKVVFVADSVKSNPLAELFEITRYSPQCWPLLALRSKRLNIALGNMLLTNPERAVLSQSTRLQADALVSAI